MQTVLEFPSAEVIYWYLFCNYILAYGHVFNVFSSSAETQRIMFTLGSVIKEKFNLKAQIRVFGNIIEIDLTLVYRRCNAVSAIPMTTINGTIITILK